MKTIELKKLEMDDGEPFDYKEIMGNIVRQPNDPTIGITIEEIRKSVRILDALDVSEKTLELEDADYNTLKKKVKTYKWALAHRSIIIFVDDINNAQEVKKEKEVKKEEEKK